MSFFHIPHLMPLLSRVHRLSLLMSLNFCLSAAQYSNGKHVGRLSPLIGSEGYAMYFLVLCVGKRLLQRPLGEYALLKGIVVELYSES